MRTPMNPFVASQVERRSHKAVLRRVSATACANLRVCCYFVLNPLRSSVFFSPHGVLSARNPRGFFPLPPRLPHPALARHAVSRVPSGFGVASPRLNQLRAVQLPQWRGCYNIQVGRVKRGLNAQWFEGAGFRLSCNQFTKKKKYNYGTSTVGPHCNGTLFTGLTKSTKQDRNVKSTPSQIRALPSLVPVQCSSVLPPFFGLHTSQRYSRFSDARLRTPDVKE